MKRKTQTVTRTHLNRTIKALRTDAEKRVKAAYWSGMQDAEDEPPVTAGGITYQRRGYRSRITIRDETPTSQEAAIERSSRQYATNPLAYAIANTRTDYVWGDGPVITADNDEVQAILDAHWYDDTNDWEGKGAQRVRDLGLYGELFIEAFVRWDGVVGDGQVRLGAIDSAEIDRIITDADNREEIVAVQLKAVANEPQQRGRLLKVICIDPETGRLHGIKSTEFAVSHSYAADDVITRSRRHWRIAEANRQTDKFDSGWENARATETCYGRAWRVSEAHGGMMYQDRVGAEIEGVPYDGQCFIVQVNKTSIGMRGRPDGLALIDWLDRTDQLFFDILEHAALLKDTVWDLLVNGADEKELDKQDKKFRASSSQAGRVFAHNESIVLTDRNPDLKAADWSSLYDTILNFLAGGARLPVYMLGSGGDANLATATAQGSPTYRGFETRQGVVRRLLIRILQYQVDCAVEAKRIPEEVEILDENGEPKLDRLGLPMRVLARDCFDVQMPEISPRDTVAAATTFSAVATAVTGLYSMKLLPLQTAVELEARAAELLGVEIEIDKVVAALQTGPDTSGLADALDKAQPGGNGQQPSADLSSLLAVMNQGARQESKGNDGQIIEMRVTHLDEGRATEDNSMLSMQQFYALMHELESIRLAQDTRRSSESLPAPIINMSLNPAEMTLAKTLNLPAPVVNVEVPVGDLANALERVIESSNQSSNAQLTRMVELLSRINEAAQPSDVQPVINITVPEQSPPVILNTINVPQQPPPIVTVEVPEQKPVTKRVIRDRQGLITEVKEEPE
ncbi:MAG TPA: hypothetical protein VII92_11505 [Anaerolineae bacterium]